MCPVPISSRRRRYAQRLLSLSKSIEGRNVLRGGRLSRMLSGAAVFVGDSNQINHIRVTTHPQ